jgi:hypothetical protein
MKPVDQVRIGFGRGQCTEAAIASLLGVPLDAVPDLWAGPDAGPTAEEQQPIVNLIRMWEWLKTNHGVQLCGVRLATPMPLYEAWMRARDVLPGVAVLDDWARWNLAVGPNPDGVGHYVVCRDGTMVHDPNPRRRGIVECTHVQWLVPLGLLDGDVLALPSAEWVAHEIE